MLRVGTDCSGIEAPIQALEKLGVKYNHVFSSDIDIHARESILANYNPGILFEDMTKERKLPKLDLYVAGFPCQSFSMLGNRKGSEDPRGNIFLHCVKVIKQSNPSIFILENVKGIITVQKGEYFKSVLDKLKSLKKYDINYMLLNTKDYGIPQNRERLFIVGLLKKNMIGSLQVPKPVKCEDIFSYIDKTVTKEDKYCSSYMKKYHIFNTGTFVDIDSIMPSTKSQTNPKYSTTITTHDLWCIPMNRKATIKECLSLQGFPEKFKQVVSDRQMRKQIGNSMSVNVLCFLLRECFKCVTI